uniref:Uncharacterized protein n=1 Tax=Utricularia reniformis TaxID=192314 RepID=A0A1Y0B0I7_9LAMI|nr:hypothetical protein AEK19_MT0697 [Utricularia reniformis]ART30945.1 hypothetical protein AEK19_MT0697 [Utricularia reniformis]
MTGAATTASSSTRTSSSSFEEVDSAASVTSVSLCVEVSASGGVASMLSTWFGSFDYGFVFFPIISSMTIKLSI